MAEPVTTSNAQTTGTAAGAEAVASQGALLAESMKLNTAMAWLQMGIALAGKIAGR